MKKKERINLLLFFLLSVGSLIFLLSSLYFNNTEVSPSIGGTYREGVVGQPRFINPIYGETNDIDRSLISLIFSGLMTYDGQGKIVNDLADSYTISADGKTYEFWLKDNAHWHDGKALTIEDIIFTIKTIQNSDYKSPLRANWIDIDVVKSSEKSLKFELRAPYNSFLDNLTVKILPKHIWQNISPENFILSSYNLQPIGSGPFKFKNLKQTSSGFIKTVALDSNRKYHGKTSFISKLSFIFFEKNDDLIQANRSNKVDGFSLPSLENSEADAQEEIRWIWQKNQKLSVYYFSLPRYFSVFFNPSPAGVKQKSSIFADENVRKALSYAVDKDDIIKKLGNNVLKIDSPILPEFFGYQQPSKIYNFDAEKAGAILDKAGFKANSSGHREKPISKKSAFQFSSYLKVGSKNSEVNQLQSCLAKLDDELKNLLKDETSGTYGRITEKTVTEFQKKYLQDQEPTGEVGKMTRKKLNELCLADQPKSQPLKFILVTIDQQQLTRVANLLRDYWQKIGVQVEIRAVSITDIKPIIKNRNYDALLYGEALGAEPDPYPFWHSSQKLDPGLNLSSYENKEADKLLKEARETLDKSVKQQKLEKLQDIIINDAPALFLYNPDFVYWVSERIKGIDTFKVIDPAKRFSNITNWHIKTKRVWK